MMGFESLSAMYRPASVASGKDDRAWLRAEADRQMMHNRQLQKKQAFRLGAIRRAAARFVALLF